MFGQKTPVRPITQVAFQAIAALHLAWSFAPADSNSPHQATAPHFTCTEHHKKLLPAQKLKEKRRGRGRLGGLFRFIQGRIPETSVNAATCKAPAFVIISVAKTHKDVGTNWKPCTRIHHIIITNSSGDKKKMCAGTDADRNHRSSTET